MRSSLRELAPAIAFAVAAIVLFAAGCSSTDRASSGSEPDTRSGALGAPAVRPDAGPVPLCDPYTPLALMGQCVFPK